VVVGFKGGNLGFPKAHLRQIARTVTLFFLLFPAVPVPVFARFGTIQAIGAASPSGKLDPTVPYGNGTDCNLFVSFF